MSKEHIRQPVVLVTGARAPSALHAARLFHMSGARVIAADCMSQPLSLADGRYYETRRYPGPVAAPKAFQSWIIETCENESVDLIFPTCEEVFHLASALADHPLESTLFAPYFDLLLWAHSKMEFPAMLDRIGLAAPATERLRCKKDLNRLGDLSQVVLKPEFSRFATSTLVRPSREDISRISPSDDAPWVYQELLEGPEVCIYGIASDGRLTAFSAYSPKHRAGKGAGTYFDPVEDGRLHNYAETFARETLWNGQFAMDVILTEDQGPVAIECNPRSTSGIHFFEDGSDFVAAIIGRGTAEATLRPKMITQAVWTSGLLHAVGQKDLKGWRNDVRRASGALDVGPFGAPVGQMLCTLASFALSARKSGVSALEATTSDIAWNTAR